MVVEEKGGHLQSFFLFLLFLPFVSRSVPRRRSDQKNKQEQKKPQGGTTSLRKHNPHSKMVEYETKWSFGEREKKTRTISLTSMECGFSNELSLGSIVFVLFLFVCFFTGSRFVVSASFFVLLRNYFFYSARTNFQKRNQEEVDWRWICFDFWKMKSMALKTIDEAWPSFSFCPTDLLMAVVDFSFLFFAAEAEQVDGRPAGRATTMTESSAATMATDYDAVRDQTLLFFLERLLERGQARSLHDLSCQFGARGFTKTMRQVAGGSQQGLRKFLQQHPSLFTVTGDQVPLFFFKKKTLFFLVSDAST